MNKYQRMKVLNKIIGMGRSTPMPRKTRRTSLEPAQRRKFEIGDAAELNPKKDKRGRYRRLYNLSGIIVGYGTTKGYYHVSFPEISKEYKIPSSMLEKTEAQKVNLPEVIE